MRVVDTAVLATLKAANVNVMDGFVIPVGVGTKVVDYPVPYAVYYSNTGDRDNPRLTGRGRRDDVFFSITYVGLNREQAKWCGEKVRAALVGKRLTISGRKTWLVRVVESQRVRRDDDAVRPDGAPLFYGVDNYSVAVTAA